MSKKTPDNPLNVYCPTCFITEGKRCLDMRKKEGATRYIKTFHKERVAKAMERGHADQGEAFANLPRPEDMTPEQIREVLEKSAKGAAEVHRKWNTKYWCCPNGCCMCRRY